MRASIAKGLAALALVALTLEASAATPDGEAVVVRVEKTGAGIDVYAALTVAATLGQTWAVLVDYDRMGEILSNVDASRIVKRAGNQLEVAQTTHLAFGPIKISLDNRRRVVLIPQREIRSHLIEGDVKASDFTTRLIDERTGVRVVWRGRIVPGPLAGLAITADAVERELRRMCRELRAEILRRTARPAFPACRLAEACD
jgi:carbon monoxide dehydrogenase subunit G